jgi:hypothetical protein
MTPWRTAERYQHQQGTTLRNPRIVPCDAVESRQPALARPIFRAATLPGYLPLDE